MCPPDKFCALKKVMLNKFLHCIFEKNRKTRHENYVLGWNVALFLEGIFELFFFFEITSWTRYCSSNLDKICDFKSHLGDFKWWMPQDLEDLPIGGATVEFQVSVLFLFFRVRGATFGFVIRIISIFPRINFWNPRFVHFRQFFGFFHFQNDKKSPPKRRVENPWKAPFLSIPPKKFPSYYF